MDSAHLFVWQAPFWTWCLTGAAFAALAGLLWSATSYWSARLLKAEPPTHRILPRIAGAALVGAVLGGAGHGLRAQAQDCAERGVGWNRCRVALLEKTDPSAPFSAAQTPKLAAPPPKPHRR